jgi:hypothetical protein
MTNVLAHVALAEDEIERAEGLAREALAGFARQRERLGVAEALDTLAAVAAARGDAGRASRLDGASKSISETIASLPAPFERAISGRFIKASQQSEDASRWRSAWEAGHDLSLDEAIDFASS